MYLKEEINNYSTYVMNLLKDGNDSLKNIKDTSKQKLRLDGSNQDVPLDFIFQLDCMFFFVLFSDRILIYKYEEVRHEKEKVRSYICLNFVNQNQLKEFYLLKNAQYLLIMTIVNHFYLFIYISLFFVLFYF